MVERIKLGKKTMASYIYTNDVVRNINGLTTLLGLKATHCDETSHDAGIETRSTEHFHVVTTTRNTLRNEHITRNSVSSLILITVTSFDVHNKHSVADLNPYLYVIH